VQVYTADGRPKEKGLSFAPQGVTFAAHASAAGTYDVDNSPVVQMNTKEFDPFNWYDTSTYRWTPKAAGYYEINWQVHQGAWLNQDSSWRALLYKNGTLYRAGDMRQDESVQANDPELRMSSGASSLVYLNGSTDYLDIRIYSNYTADNTRTIRPGPEWCWWNGHLVASSIGVAPEPWHVVGATGEPAFLNGWTNTASVSDYGPCRFRKDPHGVVWLEGYLVAVANNDVFTLPVGYRPGQNYLELPIRFVSGGAYTMGLCQIRGSGAPSSAGNVRLYNNTGAAPAAGASYIINGLSFLAGS
jgi:hypothetical protein